MDGQSRIPALGTNKYAFKSIRHVSFLRLLLVQFKRPMLGLVVIVAVALFHVLPPDLVK
jgi:hypothetical protein